MNTIGHNIAKRRRALNLTQEDLANTADISTNYVSRIERGESKHIRAETLYEISKALETTMENLINSKEDDSHIRGHYEHTLIQTLDSLSSGQRETVAKSILNLLNINKK